MLQIFRHRNGFQVVAVRKCVSSDVGNRISDHRFPDVVAFRKRIVPNAGDGIPDCDFLDFLPEICPGCRILCAVIVHLPAS